MLPKLVHNTLLKLLCLLKVTIHYYNSLLPATILLFNSSLFHEQFNLSKTQVSFCHSLNQKHQVKTSGMNGGK